NEVTTTTLYTNPQTFSIGAWFKTSSASGKKIIGFESSQTGTGSASYDRQIYVGSDGKLYFGINDTTISTLKYATSTFTYNDNNWYYVVGTYSGTAMTLYVNAALVATNTASVAQNFNGYWRIGGYRATGWTNGSDGYFPGSIGAVHVYNVGLTSTQVLQNFNAHRGRYGNTASYPGSGTTWTDISGSGNNATISNNTFNSGESFTLNSNSNNTIPGTSLNLTGGNFTMEAWVYPIGSSYTGTDGQIFTQDSGNNDGNGWQWRITNSTNIMNFIYWTTSVRSSAASISSSTAITYNRWYQFIVTYNGATIKLYQNTTEVASANPSAPLYGSTVPIGIGMFNRTLAFSDGFNGKIASIKCYRRALSVEEIAQNYNALRNRYGI
ncbi:LamG domain-containing protein, partial [bacterium]|nr:LamG domain-containing protein [bacterium]